MDDLAYFLANALVLPFTIAFTLFFVMIYAVVMTIIYFWKGLKCLFSPSR